MLSWDGWQQFMNSGPALTKVTELAGLLEPFEFEP